MSRIIIVGTGQAGGQVAARLRPEGYEGEIVLAGAEPHPPYQRPPLSKAFLAGEVGLERVLLRPAEAYDKANVSLRTGAPVTRLDAQAHEVEFADGERMGFDQAVLATGAKVRKLNAPGAELDGIHYLRSIEDSEAIRALFGPGRTLAIVGGGYIGLEVAAVAARAGTLVTVLEAEQALMARVVGDEVAAHFLALHEREGVTVRFGARVAGFAGSTSISAVQLADGSELACTAAVVGIGVMPDSELAAAAGLEVDDGIVVDDHCRTSHADIFAAGDCTRHPSGLYGTSLRLESVHNAMTQARVTAANLAGKDASYDEVPWFWSDQFNAKLQIAGMRDGYDASVVRGDVAGDSFSIIYLREGRIIAGESVGAMPDHIALRGLINKRATPDPAALADPEVALKSL